MRNGRQRVYYKSSYAIAGIGQGANCVLLRYFFKQLQLNQQDLLLLISQQVKQIFLIPLLVEISLQKQRQSFWRWILVKLL